jgi:hypothetical protein
VYAIVIVSFIRFQRTWIFRPPSAITVRQRVLLVWVQALSIDEGAVRRFEIHQVDIVHAALDDRVQA